MKKASLTKNLLLIFYINVIAIINPTELVANFKVNYKFDFITLFSSNENQKQKSYFQQRGGLVTINVSTHCSSESPYTVKLC